MTISTVSKPPPVEAISNRHLMRPKQLPPIRTHTNVLESKSLLTSIPEEAKEIPKRLEKTRADK